MRNLYVLAAALEIAEENLRNPFGVEELADACSISVSGLHKLFKYARLTTVGDYFTKRRLSAASKQLTVTDKSITEIALDYQFNSPEVFTRAFRRFWGISPSEFRKTHRFSELFPKNELNYDENGGYIVPERRKVDISELYEEIKKLRETYVIWADICHLMHTCEKYGYSAGDLVIAEAAKRLDSQIPSNMLMFRVGGDEFAVLTGYKIASEAETLANKIYALNENTIKLPNGNEMPCRLTLAVSKIPDGGLSYKNVLDEMQTSIEEAQKNGNHDRVYISSNQ